MSTHANTHNAFETLSKRVERSVRGLAGTVPTPEHSYYDCSFLTMEPHRQTSTQLDGLLDSQKGSTPFVPFPVAMMEKWIEGGCVIAGQMLAEHIITSNPPNPLQVARNLADLIDAAITFRNTESLSELLLCMEAYAANLKDAKMSKEASPAAYLSRPELFPPHTPGDTRLHRLLREITPQLAAVDEMSAIKTQAIIAALLESGVDTMASNSKGETPADLAQHIHHEFNFDDLIRSANRARHMREIKDTESVSPRTRHWQEGLNRAAPPAPGEAAQAINAPAARRGRTIAS